MDTGEFGADQSVAARPVRIRLTARRRVGSTIIGVVRAFSDDDTGQAEAELVLSSPGMATRRVRVRAGDVVDTVDGEIGVVAVHPWTGTTPAGVTVVAVHR